MNYGQEMTTSSRSMMPSVLKNHEKTSHKTPMVSVFQGLLCIQSYKGSWVGLLFLVLCGAGTEVRVSGNLGE